MAFYALANIKGGIVCCYTSINTGLKNSKIIVKNNQMWLKKRNVTHSWQREDIL